MIGLFTRVLDMSIRAGILILAVILLRPLLKKVPRNLFMIVWVLVIVRLVCPLSVSNILSPVPDSFLPASIEDSAEVGSAYVPCWSVPETGQKQTAVNTETFVSSDPESKDQTTEILCAVWQAGTAVFLASTGVKAARLRRVVKGSEKTDSNVYHSSTIHDSFILGILRPRIYIPSALSKDRARYILDHEREHIAHLDHLFKLLFYAATAVHWFNPLCHIAYRMFSEDLEMACDERVIRKRDALYRADYLQTLLDCGAHSYLLAAGTLSFGGAGLKRRIERIVNYRKPKLIVSAAFALVCFSLVFFLMTNNASAAEDDSANDIYIDISGGSLPDGYDDGLYTFISDADGKVVNIFHNGDPEQLKPGISPDDVVADDDENCVFRKEKLLLIREEVLNTGVFRSPARLGEPVLAVCEGKVVSSEYGSGYGYCVTVLDDEGRTWKYGFCSKLIAKEGDRIAIGDLVAYTGISGHATEPSVIIRTVK